MTHGSHAHKLAHEPTSLELPAERLREPTLDDLPVGMGASDASLLPDDPDQQPEVVDDEEEPLDDRDRQADEAGLFEQ